MNTSRRLLSVSRLQAHSPCTTRICTVATHHFPLSTSRNNSDQKTTLVSRRNFSGNISHSSPEPPARFTPSYPPSSTQSLSTSSHLSNSNSTSSSTSTISYTISPLLNTSSGKTAHIQIQNAQKLNTLSSATLSLLHQTILNLSQDPSIRTIVLSGSRSQSKPPKMASFCGGANIHEMSMISNPDEAEQFISKIHQVCTSIRQSPAIIIAQIHGLCLGAGLEIAASCDFRFASSVSIFGMPEVKLGIPSVVEARLLANLIGWSRTRQMVYLAENYDAEMVHEMGLVDEVCDSFEALESRVAKCIGVMARHGPKAMKIQKELLRTWEETPLKEGIEAGIEAFKEMWNDGGTEPREYMAAFTERKAKRKDG